MPEPPLLDGLDVLVEVDLQHGLSLADEVRRLREIEIGLGNDALYRDVGDARLAAVMRFGKLLRDVDDLSPRQIMDTSREALTITSGIIEQIDGSRALLDVLGIADDAQISILPAVWASALVASVIPTEYRDWMKWHPRGDHASFDRARERWETLVRAESEWTKRLRGYDADSRADADRLREAAEAFDKGAIKRLFSRDALLKARALASELGLQGEDGVALRRLADHIESIEEFEQSVEFEKAVGPLWTGFRTDFARMAETPLVPERAPTAF